jgi:hypothetical protein
MIALVRIGLAGKEMRSETNVGEIVSETCCQDDHLIHCRTMHA